MNDKGKKEQRPLVNNGQGSTSYGNARIVISPAGEIRPVVKAARSGYANSQGTWQSTQPGDFVFECKSKANRDDGREPLTWDNVHVVQEDGEWEIVVASEIPGRWAWLRSLPMGNEIVEWLSAGYVPGRYSMFLPAGWGWDGVQTKADAAKEGRVRRMLRGLPDALLDDIVERARTSPGRELPTYWDEAGELPTALDPDFIWVAIEGRGENASAYQVIDLTKVPRSRLVRIELDAHTSRDGGRYGVRWTLYQPAMRKREHTSVPGWLMNGGKRPATK